MTVLVIAVLGLIFSVVAIVFGFVSLASMTKLTKSQDSVTDSKLKMMNTEYKAKINSLEQQIELLKSTQAFSNNDEEGNGFFELASKLYLSNPDNEEDEDEKK